MSKENSVNMGDNFKGVQTTISTIDIQTTKCKYCEIRSKSQEELTKITKKEEIIKRKDLGSGDLQQDVTEWFEIHSDKVKVKLCGDKVQKLADKLRKPGGEEKLRSKIEKYLKKVPDHFSEGDDDRMEFRKQLPDDIISHLKKMCLHSTDPNVNIFRMELYKYCSRFKMESFKKAIINWLKNLNIKKKDFLGRNVKKDDIFKYVVEKLEPLISDRPKSDADYKRKLRSNIAEIIAELPLSVSGINKEYYANKVTNLLVDDIFNIESKIPSSYIQPTITEIKEFIKDEITFFLEKSRIAISTKKMECLEQELVELLLDLSDVVDIDSYVGEEVTKVLKIVGKLPEYKAKYFSNILLSDYKEFFFRHNKFQHIKEITGHGRSDVFPTFQHSISMDTVNETTSFSVYMCRLIEEIRKWLCKINIPTKDTNFVNVVVKDLASDIVDRHKYLLLNPQSKGTDTEEFEHLKFQIFKWTNRLVGEENTTVLQHAQELMDRINNIPKPLFDSDNEQLTLAQNDNTNPCSESLTDAINDWFHELPIELYVTQDENFNKHCIKDFAGIIQRGLIRKDLELFDKEVSDWTKKVLNDKLSSGHVEQLKNRIKSVASTVRHEQIIDPKQQKAMIRSYEDIVDEWIDTIPLKPQQEAILLNNRIEAIHDLAVKIFNVKSKMSLTSVCDEIIEHKLHEEISNWMKDVLIYSCHLSRDKYAKDLVKSINSINIDKMISSIKTRQSDEFKDQLERAVLQWLKQSPLYKNTSRQDKEKQEFIMKTLATAIHDSLNIKHSNSIQKFTEHIKMLDPNQTDEVVQSRALQLKLYLQKHNMLGKYALAANAEDEFLVANTEVWLNNLPLDIQDVNHFELQKQDFTESMKRLRYSGSDCAVIKKEILTFIKSLPIDHKKKRDPKYLDDKSSKLIQNLRVVLSEDVPKRSTLKTDEIIAEAIRSWANRLPMKSVHCPGELRTFIDDMSSVITTLLLHSEPTTPEQKNKILNREIVKFLKRLPFQQDKDYENFITQKAVELTEKLKDIHLFSNNDKGYQTKSVAVFGVTQKTFKKSSQVSIHEEDMNTNLDRYTKQLINQISVWFDHLNLPKVQEDGFKEVVINDLGGDIIDRHKYLQFNPASRGTVKDELEHLRFQIFKWINKLVGEGNLETIDHAESLMKRIQAVPVPMIVTPQEKSHKQPNLSQSTPGKRRLTWQQVSALPLQCQRTGVDNLGSQSEPNPCFVSGTEDQTPMNVPDLCQENATPAYDQTTSGSSFGERIPTLPLQSFIPGPVNWQQVNVQQMYGPQTGGNSLGNINLTQSQTPRNLNQPENGPEVWTQISAPTHSSKNPFTPKVNRSAPVAYQHTSYDPRTDDSNFQETNEPHIANRMSSPGVLGLSSENHGIRDPLPPPLMAQDGTKEAVYNRYQKIFREKCDNLPIEATTPEDIKLAELAKTGIYNGIVKTFFKLKSDSEIEHDYGYFEFLLEEKIEEMLDILPQTSELVSKRHAWKIDVLTNATNMLDELHALTDRPSFRQRVRNRFNRNFAREMELEQCFLLQQGFLSDMADAYILEKKYKDDNPVKAAIYKQRLMKKIDDLTNHLSKEHNVGFRCFKKEQLASIAMKVLEDVPIPNDDDLKEEAEEIQIADEVEKWYNELPTQPLLNETDGILRKRMMDLLAKKLRDIAKRVENSDLSQDMQMKHEVSQFLEKRAKLHDDQDLNINFMVDQLHNRLKNKWSKELRDYKDFEQGTPLSSTFAQPNINKAPLINAGTSTAQKQGQYEPFDKTSPELQRSKLQKNRSQPDQDQTYQPIGISQNSRAISGPGPPEQVYGLYDLSPPPIPGQGYSTVQNQSQVSPGGHRSILRKSQIGSGLGSGQGQQYQSVGQTLPGEQSFTQNSHVLPGEGYVSGQNKVNEPTSQGPWPTERSILQNSKIDPRQSYRPIQGQVYQPGLQHPILQEGLTEPDQGYNSVQSQPMQTAYTDLNLTQMGAKQEYNSPALQRLGQANRPLTAGPYEENVSTSQMGPNQEYNSPALQRLGQANRPLTAGPYEENVSTSQMGPNQEYNSPALQRSGQANRPLTAGPYEENVGTSQMGPNQEYNSPALQRSGQANRPFTAGHYEGHVATNQMGPNQEYNSLALQRSGQANRPITAGPYEGNLATSQMGPKQECNSSALQRSGKANRPITAGPYEENVATSKMGPNQEYNSPALQRSGQVNRPFTAGPYEGHVATNQMGPNQEYNSLALQRSGQANRPLTAGPYEENVATSKMGLNQEYNSPALQRSGQANRPLTAGPYQENVATSEMGPSARYISHQIPMQSVGQRYFLTKPGSYGTGFEASNMGPGEIDPQQNNQMQSLAHNGMPRNINENNFGENQFGSNQFGPNQGYLSQQGPRQGGTASRAEARPGPYMQDISGGSKQIKSGAYFNNSPQRGGHQRPYNEPGQDQNFALKSPHNCQSALSPSRPARGALKNKRASLSSKNHINHNGFDQSMVDPRYGMQDQVNFNPNFPNQGSSETEGYVGPVPPMNGIGRRGGSGTSDERDDLDSDDLVRCRCTEAYKRRRKTCIDYDCPKLRPYKRERERGRQRKSYH